MTLISKNLMASLICAGLILPMPTISGADTEPSGAAAAAAEAIIEARNEGLFNCRLHVERGRCGSSDRCRRALTFVRRAGGGNEEGLTQLRSFIGASSMQRDCVRSLMGPHYRALTESLDQLGQPASASR